MARLRHKEVAAFSSGLSLLYSACDMASLSSRVMQCLHYLFDCEVSSFDLIDLSAVRWNTVVISPVLPKWNEAVEILQAHAHEHPILAHAARQGFSHAIRTSDLVSLREYRQSGLFHDFFRVHVLGVNRQLGFVAKPSSALTLGVSVNRRGRDFSKEQCALLEFLRPHLLQAYLTAQAAARTAEHSRTEREGGAVAAGGGLCQIDATGKLEWSTAAVERLFAHYFPSERPQSGFLPPALLQIVKKALRATRGDDGMTFHRRTWNFPREAGTLSVHLAANPSAESWQLLLSEDRHEFSPDEMAARHGLSKREAETLFWIGQGKANDEIGIILGIGTRTVEKYVERLFEKLGIYNRTAAVRVAMGK